MEMLPLALMFVCQLNCSIHHHRYKYHHLFSNKDRICIIPFPIFSTKYRKNRKNERYIGQIIGFFKNIGFIGNMGRIRTQNDA